MARHALLMRGRSMTPRRDSGARTPGTRRASHLRSGALGAEDFASRGTVARAAAAA